MRNSLIKGPGDIGVWGSGCTTANQLLRLAAVGRSWWERADPPQILQVCVCGSGPAASGTGEKWLGLFKTPTWAASYWRPGKSNRHVSSQIWNCSQRRGWKAGIIQHRADAYPYTSGILWPGGMDGWKYIFFKVHRRPQGLKGGVKALLVLGSSDSSGPASLWGTKFPLWTMTVQEEEHQIRAGRHEFDSPFCPPDVPHHASFLT